MKLANGTYKSVSKISSKDFRLLLGEKPSINLSQWGANLDLATIKEYLNQIKRLQNTRQKNTLLRVWNGDCLGHARLVHLGVVVSNECPNCGDYDTAEHMLIECTKARRTWELLKHRLPERPGISMIHYAIGINDPRSHLMLKAEILKYLMHFRELQPEQIIRKTFSYMDTILGTSAPHNNS